MQARDTAARSVSEQVRINLQLESAGAGRPQDSQDVSGKVMPFFVPGSDITRVRNAFLVEGLPEILFQQLGWRKHGPAILSEKVVLYVAGDNSLLSFC